MQKNLKSMNFTVLKRVVGSAALTVYAAAVLAAPPPPPVYSPEILVTGMNTAIYAGDQQPLKLDGTYFGKAQLGANSWEHYFEIRNSGNANLLITQPVVISGANPSDFTFTQQPANVVAPGQTTWFGIRYTPTFAGKAFAEVQITNNDADEGNYTFIIRGDGVDTPLVGPDLSADLVFYNNYKCKGIPLLYCTMSGRVDVVNLSETYDLNWATVRVYVVKGDTLDNEKYLVAEKTVKKLKAVKQTKKGKKYSSKKVKFKGLVPPGFTHIYAEVVPEDGSEDIDYTNNRTKYLYGL